MNLQGYRNDASESKPRLFVALSFVCLDSARVWLSCQAIIGISVLAGLFWVFANPVTFEEGEVKRSCVILYETRSNINWYARLSLLKCNF